MSSNHTEPQVAQQLSSQLCLCLPVESAEDRMVWLYEELIRLRTQDDIVWPVLRPFLVVEYYPILDADTWFVGSEAHEELHFSEVHQLHATGRFFIILLF